MKTDNQKRKKNKRLTGKMQATLWLVFCFFAVLIVFIIVMVIKVGMNKNYVKGSLSQKAGSDKEIPYQRGMILDRNGTVLAKSDKVYHMILDARLLTGESGTTKYLEPTVRALCAVYGYSENEIRQIINEHKDSAYYRLKKYLSYEEMAAFAAYEKNLPKKENGKPNDDKGLIAGVTFEEEFLRTYPNGDLGSHVIGFAKADGDGTYGIEQQYDEILKGSNGRIYDFYDSEWNVREEVRKPIDGNTVVSTIDANVQRIIQKYTEQFLNETGAKNAGVILMDVNNGEVLGMQSNYSYDLNNPRNLRMLYTEEQVANMTENEQVDALFKLWRNFCISDTYEPGSTFKPFTVAAALEEGIINKVETFKCDGGEQVLDYYISCHNARGHGNINAAQSIMFSCNDVLMQIAERAGRSIFADYQRHFLFGRPTGVDLPGEEAGIIMSEEQLNETELATSSFGLSFNTTMIQLGAAFASMVNGGIYYEPHVVKEIRNAEGVVLERIEPKVVCHTVSADTSEFLRDAFYMTVEEGTATAAKVEGYLIGGKTGTAQKLPRSADKYVVSFIGCVPADNPQYMIYVVIDEAADESVKSSASISSKLAGQILEEVLPYLKIYPNGEIKYPSFQITKEEVKKEAGEDGSGIVYDPSENEKKADVVPDGV